jgi:Glycosyltransferase 61
MEARELTLQCLDRAIYMPPGVCSRKAVIYDCNGNVVRDSQLLRGVNLAEDASKASSVLPHAIVHKVRNSEDEILFLGDIMELHFGHLVTEGLRHCWALNRPELNGLKIPVSRGLHSPKEIARRVIRPKQMRYLEFINAMGVDRDRLLKTEGPIRFSKVWIPQPSWIERNLVDRHHISTLKQIGKSILGENQVPSDPRPLYFSRSKLPNGFRKIGHEAELEEVLVSDGWKVAYPEKLSLPEQIRLVNSHQKFAGVIGSAMHLLMFRKDNTPFDTFYIGPSLEKEVYNNYIMMHQLLPGKYQVGEGSLVISGNTQLIDQKVALDALQTFAKMSR